MMHFLDASLETAVAFDVFFFFHYSVYVMLLLWMKQQQCGVIFMPEHESFYYV